MDSFSLEDHPIIFDSVQRLKKPLSWATHIPFAMLLIDLLRPKNLVELGVHTGNSYFAFCQAVRRLNLATRCYGVDTWQGDIHAGFYDEAIYQDVFAYNQRYVDFSTLLRCPFDQAALEFAGGEIELLHIDGLHTYEAVSHDYEIWAPLVSLSSGVILFHDTQVREPGFGVWRLWREVSAGATSYEFKHGSGLGVLVIGKALPRPFLDMLDQASRSSFLEDFFTICGTEIVSSHLVAKGCPSHSERHAKLYIDTGLGYNEREAFTQAITDKQMFFLWNVPVAMPVQSIRFDPDNDLCIIRIRRISLNDQDMPLTDCLGLETNSLEQHGDILFFSTSDPQIYIKIPSTIQGSVSKVAFEIEYILDGAECYPRIVALYDTLLQQRDILLSQKANELDNLKVNHESLQQQYIMHDAELRVELSRRKYHFPNPEYWKAWKVFQKMRSLKIALRRRFYSQKYPWL